MSPGDWRSTSVRVGSRPRAGPATTTGRLRTDCALRPTAVRPTLARRARWHANGAAPPPSNPQRRLAAADYLEETAQRQHWRPIPSLRRYRAAAELLRAARF